MAAHRKRADQRQDNRAARALTLVEPGATAAEIPTPPKAWLADTKAAWADYWTSQVAAAAELPDHHAVGRLFEFRDLAQRALSRYRRQPYVNGSQGQPVTNPAFAEAMALERSAVALEDRLGLSPKARAQLGIAFGQAALTAADLNRMAEVDARANDVAEIEGWDEVD